MNEQTTRSSDGAVASLVLGIVSLVFLGLITGIPAVICGHVSLSNMKKDPFLTGRGLAIAGLITGYLGTAWSVVAIAVSILIIGSAEPSEAFVYTLF